MTVKEFCNLMDGLNEINIDLIEVDKNELLETTSEAIINNDKLQLYNEWKNAEVKGWNIIDESYIQISVIK